jgi:Protein of unknown function (DUF3604)
MVSISATAENLATSNSLKIGATSSECEKASASRRAFFGDLHVHTSYSSDANFRMGTRTTPDDAYRFALGHDIPLPPYDAAGNSLRRLRIDRPLDFAAVTDHAEELADVRLCTDDELDYGDSLECRLTGMKKTLYDLWNKQLLGRGCQGTTEECHLARTNAWQDTIASAQAYNSPCQFTAFIGYEWSGIQNGGNMHRNVIFRNDQVIDVPISALDATSAELLWQGLDANCRNAGNDCDAITIPHNMNLSKGQMYSSLMGSGEPISVEVALQRQSYETLAEIMQHKGDSECYYREGFSEDELCNFEKLPYSSFLGKYFEFIRKGPKNDTRYMREALREGLRIEDQLGVNPFKTGFIGGTDTHISAPGAVSEMNYAGHHGAQNISTEIAIDEQLVDFSESGPGGLTVVYADENTRESLFKAMKRREAYGTSGPRIEARFFAGDDLPGDLCSMNQDALAGQAYTNGVPMGGELQGSKLAGGPRFVVSALHDAGTLASPGNKLERIQVIKGWVDTSGNSHETVYTLAGDKVTVPNDLNSCQPLAQGEERLCSVWRDPAFDAGQDAYYYARVIENPSCRWSARVCMANQVDCSNPESVPEHLSACCDASVPKLIQERAWTSPIWYKPD